MSLTRASKFGRISKAAARPPGGNDEPTERPDTDDHEENADELKEAEYTTSVRMKPDAMRYIVLRKSHKHVYDPLLENSWARFIFNIHQSLRLPIANT
jgi:hypothetical protein